MSFIGSLIGKVFGSSITEPINATKGLIKSLYLTNAQKANYQQTLNQLQAEVCKIEAAHPNNLIAGARAAIIWTCAIVLAIYWIPQYSLATFFWVKGSIMHGALVSYPLDTTKLFEMIVSLLGLGGLGILHKFIK